MGLASIDNHPVKFSGKLYLYLTAPITTKQKIKVFKVTHLVFLLYEYKLLKKGYIYYFQ